MSPTAPPKVAVLLATYEGMPWLPDQLRSILTQHDVDVRVIVSDDGSDDGTLGAIDALDDGRITVLPRRQHVGGSAQNFCHLIGAAEVSEDEYVAFADQDDLWFPDKLARHVMLARQHEADGISSSVEALYPDGTMVHIRKDHPQRRLDFICESPGPGATFLLSPAGFAQVREDLGSGIVDVDALGFHDWIVYALLRARGRRWIIDHWPSIAYRQHAFNALGANHGLGAVRTRLGMLHMGWYREQFTLVAHACEAVAEPRLARDIHRVATLLESRGPLARLRLAGWCWQLRRRPRDRVFLAVTCLAGLW